MTKKQTVAIESKTPAPQTPTAQAVKQAMQGQPTLNPLAIVLARIALRLAAKKKEA